jgi:hypothetical protein
MATLALPLIAPILGLFAPTEKAPPKFPKAGTAVSKVIGKLIGFAITTVCVVVVLLHHSRLLFLPHNFR